MIHRHTPSLIVNDGRGLPIRQVAYLRAIAGAPVETLITRLRHDNAGRLVEQQDPRLSVPNFVNVFGLSEQPLKVDSVDAGPSLTLSGLAGEELQRWDARGNHWRTTYDDQLRAVRLDANATADVEKMTYADATQDPGHNLRGQMIELEDASGSVKFHSYALTGPAVRETRTFQDAKAFTGSRTFSPLGTSLTRTDAGGHQQQSTHDVAGQLTQVQLKVSGQTNWQTVLRDARYNPAGQIIEQQAGNGVISRWHYRAADGRLHRHYAQKSSGETLQDFEYEYDAQGNITRILDHACVPTFFRNQRVDGHREFRYDSLYRLIRATGYSDAPPTDNPGRPQPTDPKDRRNYIETYEYDAGDNLVKTSHQRDGANHTFEMFIDPASNRGVRWKPGDPPPDFTRLFDPAGNLLTLQPGQPMQWNSRGELEKVTLVDRNGSSANDEEFYRYSQGKRVCKRHDTHTPTVSHFHEVRYLPGLEIRTKDNGEELHVITLDFGLGGARCLHWEKDPANIGADQLRFTLADHLGSAVKELDARAQLISDEGYLPFGVTAFYTKHSALEVAYKTVRYSAKEMDVTSLYDYGARYYAPWLGRWISADPAYDVDGLNLYAFVQNDPIGHVDVNGEAKVKWPTVADINAGVDRIITSENASYAKNRQAIATRHMKDQLSKQVTRHIEILGITKGRVRDAANQLDRMGSGGDVALAATRRAMVLVIGKFISYGVGIGVGLGGQALGIIAPGVGNVVGAGLGIGAKVAVSALIDYIAERTGMSASVNLKTSKLSANKIIRKAEYKQMEPLEYLKAKYQDMAPTSKKSVLRLSKETATQASGYVLKSTLTSMPSEVVSAISTGGAVLLGLPEIVNETLGALSDKSGKKMLEFERQILGLAGEIESSNATIHEFANALSTNTIGGIDLDDLDEQTGKITGLLHGLANAVRNHRCSQKAAA
ncbi:RHS repeat-associated core domain-containing protein [Pseudomonas sp. PHC1]|uniref:RHS repeat-associated core domain-containing protein n=1 Tax=Pseudomonas sp. PHC1 TaxID=3384759 RepID=UPI00396F60A6